MYLMLLHPRDLFIHSLDSRTIYAGQPNLPRIPFQRRIDQRVRHAGDVSRGFGIAEGLVGGSLVKAVGVGNGALASSCRGVTEKSKDGVLDFGRVVEG